MAKRPSKAETDRLNEMISPYQGAGYPGIKSEHERMLRAQSRKRRQLRKQNPHLARTKSAAQRQGERIGWIVGLIGGAVMIIIMLALG